VVATAADVLAFTTAQHLANVRFIARDLAVSTAAAADAVAAATAGPLASATVGPCRFPFTTPVYQNP